MVRFSSKGRKKRSYPNDLSPKSHSVLREAATLYMRSFPLLEYVPNLLYQFKISGFINNPYFQQAK